jgi:Flp pilus assembly protein TadD
LKNVIPIVTLSVMLSACATFSPESPLVPAALTGSADTAKTATAAQADTEPSTTNTPPTASASAAAAADLPAVELNNELMFKFLGAELAQQRGQWQSAYVTMLGIAQQTGDPRLARRAMEIALSAKKTGEALAAIRLWHELAPNSDEASQYHLSFLVMGDKLSEAKPIFTQRIKDASASGRSLEMFKMQQFLMRAKDQAEAFDMMEEVLAPYHSTMEMHLVLAQSAFAKGDTARASREARAAQAIKPDSDLAALTQAQVAANPKTSLKVLSDFLYVYPKSREVRIAFARMLVDQKHYDLARNEFEIVLQAQPKDLVTLYALGVITMQVKDLPAAEKYFTTFLDVIESDPDDRRDPSQVITLLSQIAQERNDTDAALKWLAKIEDGDSRSPAYFNARLRHAQLLAKRGDIGAARKLLKDMHANNTQSKVQIILAESQILRDADLPQLAFSVLETGVKHYPKNTDLLYDYAMAAEKSNRLGVMESTLRQVIKLAPTNHQAYNALGYSLAERNVRLPEAFTLIEKALQMAPNDPFILDSMGWIQFRMGHLQEAEQLLRRAYDLRSDVEIAVHLGEVLWRKGKKEDAQKYWREVKTKDPKNDTLKSTLMRLNASI